MTSKWAIRALKRPDFWKVKVPTYANLKTKNMILGGSPAILMRERTLSFPIDLWPPRPLTQDFQAQIRLSQKRHAEKWESGGLYQLITSMFLSAFPSILDEMDLFRHRNGYVGQIFNHWNNAHIKVKHRLLPGNKGLSIIDMVVFVV